MTIVINGTTGITDVNGTAAAPAITGTDTDSGMYFGTNIVALATAGTNAVTVDASQNVGIGTSSPAFKIHTESSTPAYFGTNSTSGTIVGYASALPSNSVSCFVGWIPDTIGTLGINGDLALCPRTSSTANIRFFTGSTSATERMRIDSSGNVGIGTTSLANKLTVNGSQVLLANGQIKFADATNTYVSSIQNSGGGSVSQMEFTTSSTERMRIDSSGNVGIGTTSPSTYVSGGGLALLGTYGTSSAAFSIYNNSSASASNIAKIDFKLNNTFLSGSPSAAIWALNPNAAGNNGGALVLATSANGTNTTPTEAMRIDSSGNLLAGKTTTAIGTVGTVINPSGNITISNAASTNAADGIDIYSTGAAAYRFYVQMNGSINATSTSITAISDISLKENIRDLETGLTQILALQPRRFDWKEETQLGEKNVAGFIAQEVEQVLPELVYDYKYSDTETKKAVKMGDILPTLVKAIQEQQTLITSLTARIEALEAK